MATLVQVLDDIRRQLHALDARPPDAPVSPLVERFLLAVYRLGTALELSATLDNPKVSSSTSCWRSSAM